MSDLSNLTAQRKAAHIAKMAAKAQRRATDASQHIRPHRVGATSREDLGRSGYLPHFGAKQLAKAARSAQ